MYELFPTALGKIVKNTNYFPGSKSADRLLRWYRSRFQRSSGQEIGGKKHGQGQPGHSPRFSALSPLLAAVFYIRIMRLQ